MPYWWKRPFNAAVVFLIMAFCVGAPALQAGSSSSGGGNALEGQFLVPTETLPFEPPRVGLNLRWTQQVPAKEKYPALTEIYPMDNVLVVQTFNANLLALDAESGTWVGGVSLNSRVSRPPIVRDDRVLAISKGHLLRIDMEEGDVEVEFRINLIPSAPYVLHQGKLLIPTENAEVVAIDPNTGDQEWSFMPGGAVRGALAIDRGTVYAAAFQSGVMAADVQTGTIRWTWQPSRALICSCIPAASGGKVYVGDTHGFVHCLDGDIGLPYWRYPTGSPVERCVVLPGNRLLVTTDGGDTLCLSSGTSEDSPRLLWSHSGPDRYLTRGAERLYFLSQKEHALCAVSMDDGEELWRRKLPEEMKVASGAKDGEIYLYTKSGAVVALSEAK